MKKIALLLSCVAFAGIANAQTPVSIPNANYVYTQDFNTMDTAYSTSSSNLPAGWSIIEKGTSATVNNMYKGDDGYHNAGDAYSYGLTTSTERAFGSLASGSNTPRFGVKFKNTSMDTITRVVISLTEEQWRAGGSRQSPDTTFFSYSTMNNVDTNGTWTPVSSLNLLSIVNPTSGSDTDGNLPQNQMMILDSFNVTLYPGDSIVLRWSDTNAQGNDDGLAIDDLTITFRGNVAVSVANVHQASMPLTVLGIANANTINIGYSVSVADKYALSIYDLTGRTVHSEMVDADKGDNRKTIHTSLQSGMYIIKLSNGAQTGIAKVMIQ